MPCQSKLMKRRSMNNLLDWPVIPPPLAVVLNISFMDFVITIGYWVLTNGPMHCPLLKEILSFQ